jgi:hypothetical protein
MNEGVERVERVESVNRLFRDGPHGSKLALEEQSKADERRESARESGAKTKRSQAIWSRFE